jgi:hypothetical protein
VVVVVGLVVGASAVVAPRSAAQTEPGLGQAQAALVVIDPRSAQLSFGVRFGPTVADHRNQVARATAQSTDYGLIGGALTGEGCTGRAPTLSAEQLPQVLRADSRAPADREQHTVQEGPITQSVLADERPFGQATSRLAELEVPGVLRVAGASNRTTSGVAEDGSAIATAEVEIAQLSLAAGLIELRGLRWSAVHAQGEEPHGSFTIGSATIGGVPLPTQDPVPAIADINAALGRLGLVLSPPLAHLNEGVLFVDPLQIGISPNLARDQLVGAVLSAIHPLREQLFGALLAASCDSAAAITVIDILLGSVSGGGSLTVQLGGAQATTGQADTFQGLGEGGDRPPAAAGRPSPRVPSGRPDVPSVPGGRGDDGEEASAPVETTGVADTGTESDGALAVGLVTVLLGAALMEGDRRKMRRAALAPTEPDPPVEAT